MGCSGNCDDDCAGCPPETCQCTPSNYGIDPRHQKDDIKIYLRPAPLSVRADPTPLDELCPCSTSKIKRYQCLPCIRSFVWAMTYETIEETIKQYKPGNPIAAERLEIELKDRKLREI